MRVHFRVSPKSIILSIITFAIAYPAAADSGIVERLNGTQMAGGDSCDAQCRHEKPVLKFLECKSDCQSKQQGSATPTIMVAEGGCFVNDQGEEVCHGEDGSVIGAIEQLHGNTQLANIESQSCKFQCKDHKDPYDIARCHNECNSNQQGSVQGVTRYASSIRIGDPQPVCSIDAWACFTGTGDESPAIRDVGIFGVFASGDCHHPLGCGY